MIRCIASIYNSGTFRSGYKYRKQGLVAKEIEDDLIKFGESDIYKKIKNNFEKFI